MQNCFEQLTLLTEKILRAARNKEWQKVSEYQTQREAIGNECEALAPIADKQESDAIRQFVARIQKLDAETAKLIEQNKQELLKAHKEHNKGQKAVNAYKDL